MKKILSVLLLALVALPVFAQEESRLQHLQDKIAKMEIISDRDIPWAFEWDFECKKCFRDQDAVNVFFAARDKYQENPNSFAAAFNYAMVISRKSCAEGYTLSKHHFDEAHRVFEKAKKINPNFLRVYEEQERLIDLEFFDFAWSPVSANVVYRIGVYRQHPDIARKRLDLIKQKERLGSSHVDYLEAAVICQSLNRLEDAAAYLQKISDYEIQEEVGIASMDLLYELNASVDHSRGWQDLAELIEAKEKEATYLQTYYGKYLATSEEYALLQERINELKALVKRMRNLQYSSYLSSIVAQ